MQQGYILHEQGCQYNTENIQERAELSGVRLHVAAWCNWHSKAEKLEFYNNENDYVEKPKRPLKPRKTMYKSKEDFQGRIREWEASIGHEKEVKSRGNAMTQKYYTERLLPVYIEAIQKAQLQDSQYCEAGLTARFQDSQYWLLQEDSV
jgi:hypothetical protein